MFGIRNKSSKPKNVLQLDELLQKGEYSAIIWRAFEYGQDTKDWVSSYHYMFLASKELGMDDEVVQSLEVLVSNPKDKNALELVGRTMVNSSKYNQALHFFNEAFEPKDEDKTGLCYLAECLLCTYRYQELIELLALNRPPIHILIYPIIANLCLGNLVDAKEWLSMMNQAIDLSISQEKENETTEYIVYCRSELIHVQSIVARYEKRIIDKAHDKLTTVDWHFIMFGGAVLDVMEDLDNDQSENAMNGRYGFLQVSASQVLVIAKELVAFCGNLELAFESIVYCPTRGGEIVGKVVANLLNLPIRELKEGVDSTKSLVVFDQIDDSLVAFRDKKPGEMVFVLSFDWTKRGNIVPDICGLMAQFTQFFWDQTLKMGENNQLETIVNTQSVDEVVADIHKADEKDVFGVRVDQNYILQNKELFIGEKADQTRRTFEFYNPKRSSQFE